MDIKVNGEKQAVDGDTISVTDLLKKNDVEMPEMVSVQVNEEFVDRDDFDATQVKDNDEVEFLYFMGGGCA
jgi:sulfur carrier protein